MNKQLTRVKVDKIFFKFVFNLTTDNNLKNLGWNVEKLILLSLIIANYFNFSIQQTLILQVKDDNIIVKETRFKKKKREREKWFFDGMRKLLLPLICPWLILMWFVL